LYIIRLLCKNMSCDPSVRRGDWYLQLEWIPALRQTNVRNGVG
jgi:hypothetical protein